MVKDVLLKRTGQRLSKQDFFSEKYYYGDYTKMNMYLCLLYTSELEEKKKDAFHARCMCKRSLKIVKESLEFADQ